MNAKKNTKASKTTRSPRTAKPAPASNKAAHLAAVTDAARKYLDLETLETRRRDSLDFHEVSVASISEIIRIAFEAGFDAASGKPAPAPSTDPMDILATLEITKQTGRLVGGVWVTGTIANHTFDALVFPEHAESESYELDQSRISKLNLRERGSIIDVANFDRGWDVQPTTEAAKAIVDVLAAGLAEHVFGK